jgi:opacity protein-like surface antigen
MKTACRTIFITAAAVCASIFLSPSPASGAEEDFFQKFSQVDPCNWAGFYIGFNNGATFNHFNLGKQMTDVNLTQQFYDLVGVPGDEVGIFTTFHTPGHHDTDTETIGGAQTGFNFQFGHFVVGGEGSFIGNGTNTSGKFHDFQENELFLFTERQFVTADTEFTSLRMVETTWNGFVGGKIGFCWNRFLFYATGGAAFTDAHFANWEKADTSFFGFVGKAVTPNPPVNFIGEIVSKKMNTQGDVLTGYYGGVGTDFKLTNIVSVGVEYKHIDWGNVTEHFMGGNGPVFSGNGHLDLNADQVVFKVNLLVGPIGH